MTPAESKMRILAEWRTWIGHRQSAESHSLAEARTFFDDISVNKPELVAFERTDKWEFVKGWLVNAGLVKE
jgi:hypothetical protein